MSGPPPLRDVTDAVLTMLRTVTARPGGDAGVPTPNPPSMPYWILYPLPGGSFSGPPLADPNADATVEFQVTYVGETRIQAQDMADSVRNAFLGEDVSGVFAHPITVSGLDVMDRWCDGPGGIEPIAAPPSGIALYQGAERYYLTLTPA